VKTLIILVFVISFTFLNAQEPSWLWAESFGGNGSDSGNDIATDKQDNIYITGSFTEEISFGNFTLVSNGNVDIFVVKFDQYGNCLWATNAGGIDYDRGDGIAVNDAGEVYLTGTFYDTASFGTSIITSNGECDIFVAKLDLEGKYMCCHNF